MSAADAMRPVSSTNPSYAAGLLERIILVPCPYCGAAKYEYCIGANGRRVKSRHAARCQAARSAGYVLGRQGNIRRVRQLHHELLSALAIRTGP